MQSVWSISHKIKFMTIYKTVMLSAQFIWRLSTAEPTDNFVYSGWAFDNQSHSTFPMQVKLPWSAKNSASAVATYWDYFHTHDEAVVFT
jgi:hypothetical protein